MYSKSGKSDLSWSISLVAFRLYTVQELLLKRNINRLKTTGFNCVFFLLKLIYQCSMLILEAPRAGFPLPRPFGLTSWFSLSSFTSASSSTALWASASAFLTGGLPRLFFSPSSATSSVTCATSLATFAFRPDRFSFFSSTSLSAFSSSWFDWAFLLPAPRADLPFLASGFCSTQFSSLFSSNFSCTIFFLDFVPSSSSDCSFGSTGSVSVFFFVKLASSRLSLSGLILRRLVLVFYLILLVNDHLFSLLDYRSLLVLASWSLSLTMFLFVSLPL